MALTDAPTDTRSHAPIWRRRAGDLLRTWREDAGIGTGETTKFMGWNSDRLRRIERGTYRAHEDDIRTLCAKYGVTDEVAISEVVYVSTRPPDNAWWLPYEKRLLPHATDAFWLYSQAETIIGYHPTMPLAELQEPEYARRIHQAISVRAESLFTDEEFIAMRLGMKSIFFNPGRLKTFVALIPEVALGVRDLFGPEVTRRQLQALLNPPYHPDLQVRVVPTTSVGHTLRGGATNIMTFRHPWPDTLYIDSPPVVDPIGGADRVGIAHEWLEPVLESALTHEESKNVISDYLLECG